MSIQLVKKRFTTEQYHQMGKVGIFKENDRVELLEGEIVEMSPIGRRHTACVNRFTQLFSQLLGKKVIVSVQNPIILNNFSEPQPDISLLKPRTDFYESGHPQAPDILLVVEVADTTIDYDRDVKIPLYANNGICEVWLVDIVEQTLTVYRQPTSDGYREVLILHRGESLFLQSFPEIILTVDEILG